MVAQEIGIWLIGAGIAVVGVGGMASMIWRRRDLRWWQYFLENSLRPRPEVSVRPERAAAVRLTIDVGLGRIIVGAMTALLIGP